MTDTAPPVTASDARDAARSLLARMVGDIESQLRGAPPAERNKLITKYLPILSKQLDDEKVDDATTKMRVELDGYRDEVRAALLGRFADGMNLDDAAELEQPDAPPEDMA